MFLGSQPNKKERWKIAFSSFVIKSRGSFLNYLEEPNMHETEEKLVNWPWHKA